MPSTKRYGHNIQTVVGVALGEVDIEVKPLVPWYSNDERRMPCMLLTYANDREETIWLTKDAVDKLIATLSQLRELPTQTPRSVFSVTH